MASIIAKCSSFQRILPPAQVLPEAYSNEALVGDLWLTAGKSKSMDRAGTGYRSFRELRTADAHQQGLSDCIQSEAPTGRLAIAFDK